MMMERPLLLEEDLPRDAGDIADACASVPLSSGYRARLETLFRAKMRGTSLALAIPQVVTMGRRDTLRFWFDGNESNVESLKRRFVSHIREKHLIVGREFFTVKSAPLILRKHSVLLAFDILFLDIDRNTSCIGRALREFRPHIAVIEYNASIPPRDDWGGVADRCGRLVQRPAAEALRRLSVRCYCRG
jgi:hypothetical protein